MENSHNPLQTLAEIRSMMEKSSRFISLSGMSGVIAGIAALVGALAMYHRLGLFSDGKLTWSLYKILVNEPDETGVLSFFLIDAGLVLFVALTGAFFFTYRRAHKQGQVLMSALTVRMLINLFVPLVVGAIFCFILLLKGYIALQAPVMLIFYGLGLVNGSKYTLEDIRYLGYIECVLGLIATAYPNYGLVLWSVGFGILHILYGIFMWVKYEKNAT